MVSLLSYWLVSGLILPKYIYSYIISLRMYISLPGTISSLVGPRNAKLRSPLYGRVSKLIKIANSWKTVAIPYTKALSPVGFSKDTKFHLALMSCTTLKNTSVFFRFR